MNFRENHDLDEVLMEAKVPERSPGYWENFPKRVVARLKQEPCSTPTASMGWMSSFGILKLSAAGLILVVGMSFLMDQKKGPTKDQAKVGKLFHELALMFPHQVQSVIFDKDGGAQLILADKANIPHSTPILLNICNKQGCQKVVTFSGQQTRVDGEDLDVLLDTDGNVILAGNRHFWSSKDPSLTVQGYRIETQLLEPTL